jgi:hypothetical protein
MEHHDWFDGSDERGEPVYFLPANVKKAMSSAIPTEKQLNANLYARIKHEVLAARKQRIREADTETEREEKMRPQVRLALIGRGQVRIPVVTHTTKGSQVGATGHQLPRALV